MISVGIIGSAGYVAGELIRSLQCHTEVEIDFLYSSSQAGTKVESIHQDVLGSGLEFTDSVNLSVDLVFLCLGHGNSKAFLLSHQFSDSTRIIDLGNDFRLKEDAVFEEKNFLYGLVELNEATIEQAQYVANPGCFATAIQLALLPLANEGLLEQDVHINAITGSTGAGRSLSESSHFSWRNNNVSIYKAFKHQHLGEIGESLSALQPNFKHELNFVPVRGDFSRGVFASVYTACDIDKTSLQKLYTEYYKDSKFTFVQDSTVHLKQVVNTNNCVLQIEQIDGKVLITSVIDNLLKGAAGQAIQNMNLMFGLPQETGLNFKANYF